MRTLPLRVERMTANAMTLAAHLDQHPGIERVLYPGLAGHKHHQLASRQMSGGYGALMSFLIDGDPIRDKLTVAKLINGGKSAVA